ncbi:MAG: hypothetical protein NC089_06910 [Bacteroides sp.]|nr:hypothetical protein [Bacteroides sp.]MCM1548421.1 hypothetical protein [Clostridium sp.]
MKFVADNIGVCIVPSMLAGNDWSGLVSNIVYYGWGYYILFTPLFLLTNNPYVIYYFICITNICVIGLLGMLIYHILVKYFELTNKCLAVALAVLCTTFAAITASDFSNEVPALLAVWLVAFFLAKCCVNSQYRKKQIFYTVCLMFTLVWASLVHTRLFLLWLAVGIGVLFFYVIRKKWVVHPIAFGISFVLGFGLAQGIKKWMIYQVWGVSSNNLRNAELLTSDRLINLSVSLKAAIDIIISNLYKLTMETYGLFPVCLFVIIFFIWGLFIRWKNKEKIDLSPREQLGLLFGVVYSVLLFVTIGGLVLNYGRGITSGYEEGIENAMFSGLVYIRYYFVYFGPLLVAAVGLIKSCIEKVQKYHIVILGTAAVIFYVWLFVLPKLTGRYASYIYASFITDDTFRVNFVISGLLILGGLLIYNFLFQRKREAVIIYFVLCIIIVRNCNWSADKFFVLNGPERGGTAIYEIYNTARKEIVIPEEVYVSSESNALASIVFMLNDVVVKYGYPEDSNEECLLYSSSLYDENIEGLIKKGYQVYHIAEREYLWVKGEQLQNHLEPYIENYLMQTKEVRENLFQYDNNMKFANYIYQRKDGYAAYYCNKNPVNGLYNIEVEMKPCNYVSEELGFIEIYADGVMTEQMPIMAKNVLETGKVECQVEVYSVNALEIRVYLNGGTAVRELNMKYTCLNLDKPFGAYHDEELMQLGTIMDSIEINKPVYIIPEVQEGIGDFDFNLVERYLGQRIAGIYNGEDEGCEDCFILLENDEKNNHIFDFVDHNLIICRTENYTLLLSDTRENKMAVEHTEIIPLSSGEKINIDYFRIANGVYQNGIYNLLDYGLYQVEIDSSYIGQQEASVDIIGTEYMNVNTGSKEACTTEFFLNEPTDMTFNLYEYYTLHELDYAAYISRINNVYQPGNKVLFSRKGSYFLSNTWGIEDWGQWSKTTDNQIVLPLAAQNNLTLHLGLRSFMEQEVTIFANDKEIGTYDVGTISTELSIAIPEEVLEEEYLILTVHSESTWNVDEYRDNGDKRNVGLGFEYLEFK